MIYLQLFLSFLKIGFFGFGGGYAMLSLIQNEVVDQHPEWEITTTEFADMVAISQITPGPIAINSATYVGYNVGGFWGAAVATFAVCLPAMTVMLLLTYLFLRYRQNRFIHSVVEAIKPVVVGMILSAALLLMFPRNEANATFVDVWSWILFALSLIASLRKVNPIAIILLSAVAGIAIYYVPTLF